MLGRKRMSSRGGPSDGMRYFEGMRHAASADPRVLFTGFAEDVGLTELYPNCAVYVLPSDLEACR